MRPMTAEWRVQGSHLGIMLLAASGMALAFALSQTGLGWGWQSPLIGALVAWYCWEAVATCRSLTGRFSYHAGRWRLEVQGGGTPVEVVASHFVGQRLGVLRFRSVDGARYTVALLPDSLDREGFRRLAIALR